MTEMLYTVDVLNGRGARFDQIKVCSDDPFDEGAFLEIYRKFNPEPLRSLAERAQLAE